MILRVGGFFAFSGTVYIATLTKWLNLCEREILSRQEYLGHTVLRKTIGTNFKTDERRFATDEERLVFEDTHEPIVDSELWERAHRSLKHATRRMKEGTHQEKGLLPGLVYCADCGSKMSYQTNYYKSGEPYHSFRCSSYGNRTVNCTIHHISDKVLYQLVLRSIQHLPSKGLQDLRQALLAVQRSGGAVLRGMQNHQSQPKTACLLSP